MSLPDLFPETKVRPVLFLYPLSSQGWGALDICRVTFHWYSTWSRSWLRSSVNI